MNAIFAPILIDAFTRKRFYCGFRSTVTGRFG